MLLNLSPPARISRQEKAYAKIGNEEGWSSRKIPRPLNTVHHYIVKGQSLEIVKWYKNPTINYGLLQRAACAPVKVYKPQLFA